MSAPTVGSLFAGIGGYDLGLALAGFDVRWTVELGDHPDEVLAARFPGVERYRDVREVKDPPKVDVLTGGFPCQDLSAAGKGTGIGGERSGLWSEYARIIGEVEPALVLVENVPMLLRRGMEVVVKDLVERGYSVEWDCIPAAAFGAPHLRDRVWLAAHRGDRPRVFGQPCGLFPHDWHELPPTEAGWLKWPRAGFVQGDELLELEPIAPLSAVKKGATVRSFPTPQASDGEGGRRDAEVGGHRPSGSKRGIPLATAANNTELWPTPVGTDAVGARNATARRPGGNGRHHGGTTLTDALILSGDKAMPETGLWPTPRASSGESISGGGEGGTYRRTPSQQNGTHGRYLQTEVIEAEVEAGRIDDAQEERIANGQLNPEWVEWLMGFPLGWTDPAVPNGDLRPHPWEAGEPDGVQRVAPENVRRRERLTALGNALIPPAAAWLGERARPLLDTDDTVNH